MTPTALSPSSALGWMQCPLQWRYERIDKLASGGTPATVRGTLVHAVLERLFDLPAGERTPQAALALLRPEWERLCGDGPDGDPDAAALTFGTDVEWTEWKREAVDALRVYFDLEDPNTLDPKWRERRLEAVLPSGVKIRGVIDRVDEAPDGRQRVVDYKTGKRPDERFQSKPLFQMRFYALMLWLAHRRMPARLQLMFLRPGYSGLLTYDPIEADMDAMVDELDGLWAEIQWAIEHETFEPKPSRLCDWCPFTASCPAQGYELLPYPQTREDGAA